MCKLISGYIIVINLSHLSSLPCFLLILPQGKDFERVLRKPSKISGFGNLTNAYEVDIQRENIELISHSKIDYEENNFDIYPAILSNNNLPNALC